MLVHEADRITGTFYNIMLSKAKKKQDWKDYKRAATNYFQRGLILICLIIFLIIFGLLNVRK